MKLTKKSVEKFIADRWAYSDDETITVNAKDLAEVLLALENTQRALSKANSKLMWLDQPATYTVDLRSLYA